MAKRVFLEKMNKDGGGGWEGAMPDNFHVSKRFEPCDDALTEPLKAEVERNGGEGRDDHRPSHAAMQDSKCDCLQDENEQPSTAPSRQHGQERQGCAPAKYQPHPLPRRRKKQRNTQHGIHRQKLAELAARGERADDPQKRFLSPKALNVGDNRGPFESRSECGDEILRTLPELIEPKDVNRHGEVHDSLEQDTNPL